MNQIYSGEAERFTETFEKAQEIEGIVYLQSQNANDRLLVRVVDGSGNFALVGEVVGSPTRQESILQFKIYGFGIDVSSVGEEGSVNFGYSVKTTDRIFS